MAQAILVADDEAGVRDSVAEVLRDARLRRRDGGRWRDGARGDRRHDFAVVITDLRMPGADGLAVLRKLRVSACGRRFARGAQGLRIYRSGRRLGTECASPRARLAPGL